MVRAIKLRRVGGSVGATLPKELVERLRVTVGSQLFAIDTPDGVLLTPYNPDFARAMRVYERGAARYRNALRELAD